MIDLGTITGLYERQHELHAYCSHCDRWSELDLEELVARGHGARRLPVSVRCSDCGEPGTLQVRPPAPSRTPSGWIAPPVPSTTMLTNT